MRVAFKLILPVEMEILKDKIPDVIYNKLADLEISSLDALLVANKKIFEERCLTSSQIEKLLEVVSETLVCSKFQTALEIPNWKRIRVGNQAIDEILYGGIPIHGLNEIYGRSGVGKTQFCLQLAIMAQLPIDVGGYNKDVLYICTEDQFPAKRLHELSGLLPSKILYKPCKKNMEDGIYVEHIADFEQLRICLTARLHKLLSFANIGLIVIDSIAGVFRSYNENVNYVSRKDEFNVIAEILYELVDKNKIAVVCTNQVSDDIATSKVEPCLGLAWSNYVTSRFCISRIGMSSIRRFEVVFSPELPANGCDFQIYRDGFGEVES